jgi:hypothetical protein
LQENGIHVILRHVLILLGHGRLLPCDAQPDTKYQDKNDRSRRFHGGTLLQVLEM